jgi:hypothetical protein
MTREAIAVGPYTKGGFAGVLARVLGRPASAAAGAAAPSPGAPAAAAAGAPLSPPNTLAVATATEGGDVTPGGTAPANTPAQCVQETGARLVLWLCSASTPRVAHQCFREGVLELLSDPGVLTRVWPGTICSSRHRMPFKSYVTTRVLCSQILPEVQ